MKFINMIIVLVIFVLSPLIALAYNVQANVQGLGVTSQDGQTTYVTALGARHNSSSSYSTTTVNGGIISGEDTGKKLKVQACWGTMQQGQPSTFICVGPTGYTEGKVPGHSALTATGTWGTFSSGVAAPTLQ